MERSSVFFDLVVVIRRLGQDMPAVFIVRGCKSVNVKRNKKIHFHKLPKDEELRKNGLSYVTFDFSINFTLKLNPRILFKGEFQCLFYKRKRISTTELQ